MEEILAWIKDFEAATQAAIISGLVLVLVTAINAINALVVKSIEIRSKYKEWIRDNRQECIENIIFKSDEHGNNIITFTSSMRNLVLTHLLSLDVIFNRRSAGLMDEKEFIEEVNTILSNYEKTMRGEHAKFGSAIDWFFSASRSNWFWLANENNIKSSLMSVHTYSYKYMGEVTEYFYYILMKVPSSIKYAMEGNIDFEEYARRMEGELDDEYNMYVSKGIENTIASIEESLTKLRVEINKELSGFPGVTRVRQR